MDNSIFFEKKKDKYSESIYPFYCWTVENLNDDYDVPMHWHNHIEILYIIEGSMNIYISGGWITANNQDLLIINSREMHAVKCIQGCYFDHAVISFDPEFVETVSNIELELKYLLPFIVSGFKNDRFIPGEEVKNSDMPDTIKLICSEYRNKKFGYELAIKSCLCKLLLWILRRNHEKEKEMKAVINYNDIHFKNLDQVLKYMENNCREKISVKDMASMCHMSESYFMRFFKSVMGKTFINYLNALRLSEAEKLLFTTDMNIVQIALECGFADSSYFIKIFKRTKGMSPLTFRKKSSFHK